MELKRWLLFISIVLLSCEAVYAQEGFELLQVPAGTISSVDTEIEATIENWGYDRIFVALPDGWSINNEKSDATRSYAVREIGLWRIYGRKDDPRSLLGSGEVFTGKGFTSGNPIKPASTIGTRTGWWLRPNEGLTIDIYVSEISSSGGTIDPKKIEKENPSIRVIRWYENFILGISAPGFVTAPWTVEGAALVESSLAVHSTAGNEGAEVYYDKYQKEVADAPAWDEWFGLKNSLAFMMTDTRLADINLEFPSVDESEVTVNVKPVWRVDNVADIYYAYEWKSYKKVDGITIWSDTVLDIPEWFELF